MTAPLLKEGFDVRIAEARARVPEPTHVSDPVYRVPIAPELLFAFRDCEDTSVMEPLREVTFERVLVRTQEGGAFWAWRCTDDGRHYL